MTALSPYLYRNREYESTKQNQQNGHLLFLSRMSGTYFSCFRTRQCQLPAVGLCSQLRNKLKRYYASSDVEKVLLVPSAQRTLWLCEILFLAKSSTGWFLDHPVHVTWDVEFICLFTCACLNHNNTHNHDNHSATYRTEQWLTMYMIKER